MYTNILYVADVVTAVGFLSLYLSDPLPRNCKWNVLSVSLNKTFSSFLTKLNVYKYSLCLINYIRNYIWL